MNHDNNDPSSIPIRTKRKINIHQETQPYELEFDPNEAKQRLMVLIRTYKLRPNASIPALTANVIQSAQASANRVAKLEMMLREEKLKAGNLMNKRKDFEEMLELYLSLKHAESIIAVDTNQLLDVNEMFRKKRKVAEQIDEGVDADIPQIDPETDEELDETISSLRMT